MTSFALLDVLGVGFVLARDRSSGVVEARILAGFPEGPALLVSQNYLTRKMLALCCPLTVTITTDEKPRSCTAFHTGSPSNATANSA